MGVTKVGFAGVKSPSRQQMPLGLGVVKASDHYVGHPPACALRALAYR